MSKRLFFFLFPNNIHWHQYLSRNCCSRFANRTIIYWYPPTPWKDPFDCDEAGKVRMVIHFIRHTSQANPGIDFALVRPTHRARFVSSFSSSPMPRCRCVHNARAYVCMYIRVHVPSPRLHSFKGSEGWRGRAAARNIEGNGDRNIRLMADVLHFRRASVSPSAHHGISDEIKLFEWRQLALWILPTNLEFDILLLAVTYD